MIVACKRCEAQFQLDEARVPAAGVRVRCSRCKHAFRIERPGTSEADRIERAAEQAIETGEPAFPDVTHDLAEPGTGVDDPGLGPELAEDFEDEESDWEFNDDSRPAASEAGEDLDEAPTVDHGALAAARNVVDDLLSSGQREDSREIEEDTSPFGEISSIDEAAQLPLDGISAPASGLDSNELDIGAAPPEPTAPEESFEAQSTESLDDLPDELGSPDEWDLLAREAGDEVEQDDEQRSLASRRRPRRAADPAELLEDAASGPLSVWMRRFGATAGWVATAAVVAVGLAGGLTPRTWGMAGADTQTVEGLRISQIAGRWIENALAGPIYVVSGTVENASDVVVAPGSALALELLDREGRPLRMPPIVLGKPQQTEFLREKDLRGLASEGGWFATIPLGPAEQRPFEAILRDVPANAARFRVVAAEPPAAAPSPRPAVAPVEPVAP